MRLLDDQSGWRTMLHSGNILVWPGCSHWVQPLGAAAVERPVLVGLTAGLLAMDDRTTRDPGKIFVM